MGGKQSRAIENNIRAEIERQLHPIRNDVSATKSSLVASSNEVEALKKQLFSIRNDVPSIKSSLGTSRNEVEALKKQLSTCQNTLQEMHMKLQNAIEFGKKLALTNNHEVEKLKEQGKFREEFQQDMGKKLQKMISLENQVHSCNVEVLSNKNSLEVSNINVNALGEKVMSFDKFHEDLKLKLNRVMELETLISSNDVELVETKTRLKASKEDEEVLRNELLGHDHYERGMGTKLGHLLELEKQQDLAMSQTTLSKDDLEGLKNEEDVLREQLLCCEKFQKGIEMKLLEIMRLEESICVSTNEVLSAKESIESLKHEEEVLKEELIGYEKFLQDVEMNLRKVIDEELKAKNDLEFKRENTKGLKEKFD